MLRTVDSQKSPGLDVGWGLLKYVKPRPQAPEKHVITSETYSWSRAPKPVMNFDYDIQSLAEPAWLVGCPLLNIRVVQATLAHMVPCSLTQSTTPSEHHEPQLPLGITVSGSLIGDNRDPGHLLSIQLCSAPASLIPLVDVSNRIGTKGGREPFLEQASTYGQRGCQQAASTCLMG